MLKNRLMPIAALLLALLSSTAHAFWDPPYIAPTNPVAGDAVSFGIRMGVCDNIFSQEGFPQFSRQGNEIRIVYAGAHWDIGPQCVFGTGTGTFPVGEFTSGRYTLSVDLSYIDFTGPHVLTLGVVPFAVTDAAPAAIPAPTLSPLGLLALILALAALTAWALHARRTGWLLCVTVCAPFGVRTQGSPHSSTFGVRVTNAAGTKGAAVDSPTPARDSDGVEMC